MKAKKSKENEPSVSYKAASVSDMTVGSPMRQIIKFALPLIFGYILQQMYLVIDAAIVGRWIGVEALAAVGASSSIMFLVMGFCNGACAGFIMLQSANNALGTTCVAAFTASIRIKYLFTCVFENIGVAMATYCGQNLGARQMARITKGVKDAICLMLAYFVFTFIVIYPFADWMMRLFVDSGEAEVVSRAAEYMRIANYFYPTLGLLTILRYSIQGLGFSNLSMLSGVMEMIARCGVSLWLVPTLAWTGVCLGDPVAWIMADIFLIPAFLWVQHRLKKQAI